MSQSGPWETRLCQMEPILPPALRLLSKAVSDTFYDQLKTVLFDRAEVGSTSE